MGDRRRMMASREKVLFTKRFFPAGTYTWTVPAGCNSVDVFLVGAGGGSGGFSPSMGGHGGGGGGYTKTFRGSGYVAPSSGTWEGASTEGRDGNAIAVTPGQSIQIIVGAGVANGNGGYSQFMNSSYRAEGGKIAGTYTTGGAGGSGGGTWWGYSSTSSSVPENGDGGSDGGNGGINYGGKGQGHTTRDFGEPTGGRNAGGGTCGCYWRYPVAGQSDYTEGKGEGVRGIQVGNEHWRSGDGGGGYGGGASHYEPDAGYPSMLKGGDGTVLIRYYAYE